MPKWEDCPAPLGSSAADGSRIDATQRTDRISCQYQQTSWSLGRSSLHVCRVVPLSHFRALATCASSGPGCGADPVNPPPGMPGTSQGPRHWFPGHWAPGIGVRTSQGGCLRPLGLGVPARISLRPLPLPPCLEAWGEACQGPRHLRYPPLTQFPGGRPPPCPTECPRSRRCPRRGRWRPRSPVLRRAPRPSTCSETSGASPPAPKS